MSNCERTHSRTHVERHAHSWRHVVHAAMCPSVKALLTITVSLLETAVKDRIATQSDEDNANYKEQMLHFQTVKGTGGTNGTPAGKYQSL